MKRMSKILLLGVAAGVFSPVLSQSLTKAYVGDVIQNVEDGIDEFEDYLKRRGDDARDRTNTAREQGAEPRSERRRGRGQRGTSSQSPEDRQAAVDKGSDELEDAVSDLEGATDRLRRRFRRVGNYLDTKTQVDNVIDKSRELNQVVARGQYRGEVSRIWAALRTQINELARIYNVTPLAI